jgi:hypothetical protein
MRRLVWFTVLAFALAAPAVGFALSGTDDGTLSVKAGMQGLSELQRSLVGRLQHGVIQITDPLPNDGPGVDFSGCDERDWIDTTSICRGTNLRFRAIGGKYQILIKGTNSYLSAVGYGYAVLNGAGDDLNIATDGTYSLNDGPYKSLPNLRTTFNIVAPPGG